MKKIKDMRAKKLEYQERIELARLQTKFRSESDSTQTRAAIDVEKIRTDRDKAAANVNAKLTEAQLKTQNLALGYDTFG